MNKVFKVIWSKSRNCYIAVSELAKNRTKSSKSGVISRSVVSGILTAVLSCGAVMPVSAETVFPDDNNRAYNSSVTVYGRGNTAYGQFPVKLTESELAKIKKEFPDNWENLISELAEYQEMHGFVYYHALYPIRRYASTGNPNGKKLRKSGYVDPPKLFYHGKAIQPSNQFFVNLIEKMEKE